MLSCFAFLMTVILLKANFIYWRNTASCVGLEIKLNFELELEQGMRSQLTKIN